MQCAYALLMLCHKASTNHSEDDIVVQGYIELLRQALRIIVESLENYATAFEALDGMRGMLLFAYHGVLLIEQCKSNNRLSRRCFCDTD